MSTDVEAAYVRLQEILQTAALVSSALPVTVTRNNSLRDLFGEISGGSRAYLNLVDEDARILDQIIDHSGFGADEFIQPAAIEWIVREFDPALRDQRFDAGVAAIAQALRDARGDAAWDDLNIESFERANLSAGPLPGIKAGRIQIGMLLTAPDVLGAILSVPTYPGIEAFLLSGTIRVGLRSNLVGALEAILAGGDITSSLKGAVAGHLEPFLATGDAALFVTGALSGSLEPVLGSGSIAAAAGGNLSGEIMPILGTGLGRVAVNGGIAGQVESILGSGLVGAETGGVLVATIDDILGTGQAAVQASANLSSGIDEFLSVATAEVGVSASGAGIVEQFLATGQVETIAGAVLTGQIESILATGSAQVAITGDGAGNVEAILSAGQAAVAVQGSATAAIEPIQATGEVSSFVEVSGGGDVEPVLGSGAASVQVQATGGGSIGEFLGTGAAQLLVEANGAGVIGAILGTGDVSVGSGGGSYTYINSEASDLVGEMTVEPDDVRKAVIDDFYTRAKLQSAWSQMDRAFGLGAHDSQAAHLDWVDPVNSTPISVNGTPTFIPDVGYEGDNASSAYLDTNWNASTEGVNFVEDDASYGIFQFKDISSDTNTVGIHSQTTMAPRRFTGGTFEGRIMQSPGRTASNDDARGFFLANRTGDAAAEFFKDSESLLTVTDTGFAPQNYNATILGIPSLNQYSDYGISFAIFGGSLSDDQQWVMYEAVRRYLFDIGAFSGVDDFERADENLEDSDSWTRASGAAGDAAIVSNKVQISEGASGDPYYVWADLTGDDGFVEVDIDAHMDFNFRIFARRSAGANGFEVRMSNLGRINVYDNGSFRAISSDLSSLYPAKLRLEVKGSLANVWLGDTKIFSDLAATNATGDTFGIASAQPTTVTIDNFKCGTTDIFTDDFNRADENLEASDDWTKVNTPNQAFVIVDGMVEVTGGSGDAIYACPITAIDAYAQFEAGNTVEGYAFPAALRIEASDTYLGARYVVGQWQIMKVVNGSFTIIGTHTAPISVGDICRLEAVGDNARLIVNGEEVVGWTSLGGDLSSGSIVGMMARWETAGRFNSFEAGWL